MVLAATTLAALAAPTPSAMAAGPPRVPAFRATVTPLPESVRDEMTGVSWKEGCPVPLSDLRLVRLLFRGFDGVARRGELVVHADVADAVVRIFHTLYDARFPIRRMVRVDSYGASDDASMADDNTSAFNCRPITGSTSGFSVHSYGKAIDIDTIENPYVKGSTVLPPAGTEFLDRSNVRPGMIVAGDVVTRAFATEGFTWGGNFSSLKDYQHFEAPI
jgi:hypothetical protein